VPDKRKFEAIRRRMKKNHPSMSEDEIILYARSLAATPDERWRMHEQFLRLLGLHTRAGRMKHGFKY
jgi:hypothetical protein